MVNLNFKVTLFNVYTYYKKCEKVNMDIYWVGHLFSG